MSLPLVRVELIPAADSGIEPIVTEFEGDTGGEIALPPGGWTVKLYGYIDAGQPPVAAGTAGNVEVFSGKTTHVTVTMTPEPITTEFTGTGYLHLEIKTALTDVDSVTVTAIKDGKAYAINAPSTTALESGYYFVTTQVTRSSGAIAAYEEIVWIYPEHTAYWIITVNAEDFYLKDGNLKLNILFNPDNPPLVQTRISEVHRGDVISLSVKPGSHSRFLFYLDGVLLQESDAASCTIQTDSLPLGNHSITVVAYNEAGIPWSTSMRVDVIKTPDAGVRVVSSAGEFNTAIQDASITKILLASDIFMDPVQPVTRSLAISSQGSTKVVQLSSNGSLFTIAEPGSLTIENVTVKGKDANTAALISVNGGTLVLEPESKITGNTVTKINAHQQGGGVYATDNAYIEIRGGTVDGNHIRINSSQVDKAAGLGAGLYLKTSTLSLESGLIQNNSIESINTTTGSGASGAGVAAEFGSTIHMKGGTVRGNRTYTASSWWTQSFGAGVAVSGASEFVMDGGTISGNVAETNVACEITGPWFGKGVYHELGSWGGAVGLWEWDGLPVMKKTGGIIYGKDAAGVDADGFPLRNMAGDGRPNRGYGHAVYTGALSYLSDKRFRDTTAGEDVVLNSGSAEGWE
jgi:hypothetical protein